MTIEAGDAPGPDAASRTLTAAALRRAVGWTLTCAAGPAAMLFALLGLKMGVLESAAVLFLLSVWLGPRLLRP